VRIEDEFERDAEQTRKLQQEMIDDDVISSKSADKMFYST
jgi:hypothetical protein